MDSQYPKRVFHHVKIWLIIALIALILGLCFRTSSEDLKGD